MHATSTPTDEKETRHESEHRRRKETSRVESVRKGHSTSAPSLSLSSFNFAWTKRKRKTHSHGSDRGTQTQVFYRPIHVASPPFQCICQLQYACTDAAREVQSRYLPVRERNFSMWDTLQKLVSVLPTQMPRPPAVEGAPSQHSPHYRFQKETLDEGSGGRRRRSHA